MRQLAREGIGPVPSGLELPHHINFRISLELRDSLYDYLKASGMTLSQGLRTILATALRSDHQSYEIAFQRAAFREGLMRGLAEIRPRIEQALGEAIRDLERAHG